MWIPSGNAGMCKTSKKKTPAIFSQHAALKFMQHMCMFRCGVFFWNAFVLSCGKKCTKQQKKLHAFCTQFCEKKIQIFNVLIMIWCIFGWIFGTCSFKNIQFIYSLAKRSKNFWFFLLFWDFLANKLHLQKNWAPIVESVDFAAGNTSGHYRWHASNA